MNSLDKRNSVKKDYDLIAEDYSKEYGTYIEDLNIYEEFESYLKPGSKILDLGCGTGRTYSYFNKKGYEYVGIDFSSKMMEYAFKLHGNFSYILDDIINIKNYIKDNSIDAVFAVYSLFHLPLEDLKKVIDDVYDVLKDNGVFLLSLQLGNGEAFVDEPCLKENGKNVLYMNYLTKKEIYSILTKFDIIYETEKHERSNISIGEDGNEAIYIIARKR